MVEICERCGVSGNEVRLFDAIYDGRMSCLCERCSVIENVPIIKKPGVSQLKESEKGFGVYDRMKRLTGVIDDRKEKTFFQEDKLKELDKHPEFEMPEKESLNLVEHFHWEIMKNRRRKGQSQKQLAETIGESEIAVQMLEKGKIPENPEIIIRKLEQFFQVRLRKVSEAERLMKEREKRMRNEPILLDENGVELDIIPEPEIEDRMETKVSLTSHPSLDCEVGGSENIESITQEGASEVGGELVSGEEQRVEQVGGDIEEKPVVGVEGEFDLKKTDAKGVTIGQLKELHKKRIEVTRQEQLEEKKKIEERQRILQALRERDRLKRENKRRGEELEKKRVEEQKQNLVEQRKQENQLRKENELKELDEFLGGSELIEEGEQKDKSNFSEDEFDKELL